MWLFFLGFFFTYKAVIPWVGSLKKDIKILQRKKWKKDGTAKGMKKSVGMVEVKGWRKV